MKLLKFTGFIIVSVLLISCKSKLSENYHMDKKYWDIPDYEAAISQIKYYNPKEEGNPRLSDPNTVDVFKKLIDSENVSIVLQDNQLGLTHRKEKAQKFFDLSKEIQGIYQELDPQDKFVYPVELVRSIKFSLNTQLLYFKVSNEAMIKNSLNPEDEELVRIVKANEQTAVNNFNLYIEFLTKEDAFNDEAIVEYIDIINTCYPHLLKEFPNADYTIIKNTITTINKKIKSIELKNTLEKLIIEIDKKKE